MRGRDPPRCPPMQWPRSPDACRTFVRPGPVLAFRPRNSGRRRGGLPALALRRRATSHHRGAVVTRVGHPLAPGHELPLGVLTKAVAHAAVAAGEPHPALDRGQDRSHLRPGDLAHRPDRHDQVELRQIRLDEPIEGIGHRDLEPVGRQHAAEDLCHPCGLMALPPALDDQCSLQRADPPSRRRVGRQGAGSYRVATAKVLFECSGHDARGREPDAVERRRMARAHLGIRPGEALAPGEVSDGRPRTG